VNVGPVWWRNLPTDAAAALLADLRQQDVTYDHVGSTLEPDRWPGRRIRQFRRDVGEGDGAFTAVVDRLRSWAPQRALGADVLPSHQQVEAEATVLIVLRYGPLRIVAPDRVVAVVDEPARFAFAYGTLPGHPEMGEESFTIEQLDSGTVRATIRIDARPATTWGHVAAPAMSFLQTAAVRRYLAALVLPH
jgi:uncharacterized protein (UPF0548 family)